MSARRKRARRSTEPAAAQPPGAPEPGSTAEPPRKVSNLALRLATAAVAIPVLLLLLFVIPPPGWFVLVAIAIGAATAEALLMTLPDERAKLWVAVPLSLGWSSIFYFARTPTPVIAGGIGVVLLSALMFLLRPGDISTVARRLAFFLFSVTYPTVMLAPVGLLHRRTDGPWWVLLALAITWLADTGAYFAGRFLGQHKLMPSVSPAKTVEGAVGGVAAAITGSLVVTSLFLPAVPLWHAALLGAIGGALNIVGDLCESLLKRSVGVKDSGNLLPGHGGMLDRVDALMFTAPAVWLYAELVVGR